MKKILICFCFLLFLVVSCKEEKRTIVVESDPKDYYCYSLSLGDSFDVNISSYYGNEEIENILDDDNFKYYDEVAFDSSQYPMLCFKWINFNTFNITCVKEFDNPIEINRLNYSSNNIYFSLPIYIKLTYDNSQNNNNSFLKTIPKNYQINNEIVSVFEISPSKFKYNENDKIVINSISVLEQNVQIGDVLVGGKKPSLYAISSADVEYSLISYPYEINNSFESFAKISFVYPEEYYNFGFDVYFVLTINGDIQTSIVHLN